jgi:drug/metabolite transporter (DMT)-like permease
VVVLVNALINRSLITYLWGYAETGRFSLAYDLGARIINALGLSFDFIFFQFAVRRQHQLGRAQAQMQLKDNLTLLLAVLMPACCGLWLVLPALEASLIAQDFHSSFALYLSLLLPGFFCLALAQFGLNPLFQIDHRTLPICGAALLGLISNGVLLLLFFDHLDGAMMAIIQSVSSVVVMMALGLMAMRSRTQWPEWHAIAHIMCGCIIMTVALWPLRYWHAGLPLLMVEIAAGACLYLLYLWFVNFAGLRAIVQNIALNFGRHS